MLPVKDQVFNCVCLTLITKNFIFNLFETKIKNILRFNDKPRSTLVTKNLIFSVYLKFRRKVYIAKYQFLYICLKMRKFLTSQEIHDQVKDRRRVVNRFEILKVSTQFVNDIHRLEARNYVCRWQIHMLQLTISS